ncbi:MAG: START-like domain-containing protein [Proteiniphilum sp.]|nr:START-like domain-containing protein [Proteiniphilum sp.]MDD3908759.1 START-like domain-containing protein [Proteiniphilum sp.]MDD4416183.1 START-like domain-containing protein [Proteiniphilum sp.]
MSKEKFHIEFLMGNATQSSLWRMISQIDGLSEWFADEVSMDETETIYTFTWGKSSNQAMILNQKPQSSIRYRWIDEGEENYYFEFLLRKLELSGDVTLEVTDFADPSEKGDAITLWESQIDELKRRLGI